MNTILELQSAHIESLTRTNKIPQWAQAEHLERIESQKELWKLREDKHIKRISLRKTRILIAKALRKMADALSPEEGNAIYDMESALNANGAIA